MYLAAALVTLPETNPSIGRSHGASLARVNLRLLTLPAFRVYALAGACATTSFYAFLASAPFIFIDMLHQAQADISFYFIVPMLGYSVGSLIANRLVNRMGLDRIMLLGLSLATLGAGLFFLVVITGHLSVPAVLLTMLLFTAGGGTASPMALSGAISVLPGATGAAAGLYGFTQMAYGTICTYTVGLYSPNPALIAASIMFASLLLSQAIFFLGRRHPA